jgi:hypothetical protein
MKLVILITVRLDITTRGECSSKLSNYLFLPIECSFGRFACVHRQRNSLAASYKLGTQYPLADDNVVYSLCACGILC